MEDDKFYEFLELYRNPEHYGKPGKFSQSESCYSPSCGDRFVVYLELEDGRVKNASFEGSGCVISTVATSKLCSYLIGRSLSDVKEMNLDSIKKLLGVTELSISRVKCATVSLEAVKKMALKVEGPD